MIPTDDRFNNFLVLERFNQLSENNLNPKLGVYAENRLKIVSQERTNFFAKIFQLFMNVICTPLMCKYGKLSFDKNRITVLTNEIKELKTDVDEKRRVVTDLNDQLIAKGRELENLNESLRTAARELEGKNQAIRECELANGKTQVLNVVIKDLELRLEELSGLEKELEPQEQQQKHLESVIRELISEKSKLESDVEQLKYKKRVESQSSTINHLQQQVHRANGPQYGTCPRCYMPVATFPRN